MKKLLILSFLFLSACSKDSPNKTVSPENVNTHWYAGVGQFNGSLDFGNLTAEQNKILTVTIKNVGDSTLSGPVTVGGSDFYLAYQNCGTLLPGKTCSVKVGFNSQGKLNQSYSTNLTMGDQSALVFASVDLPVVATELEVTVGGTVVNSLEFGTIKFDQSVIKTVVITNKGKDKGPFVVEKSGNGFVISYDSCSGKEILPTKSCTLKISLSGAGKSGEITDTLTFGNLELPMTALVKNLPTVALEESDVKVLVNSLAVNPGAVDLGTWNLRQTKILNLYLKNEGTDKGVIEEPEIPQDLQLAFNNCEPGKILNPKSSCLMKLVASPRSKGVSSSPLILQGNNYNLQAVVREPGDKIFCPMDNALESYITWSGSNYSDCIIESCESTHHLLSNACDPNIISCPVDNGQGLQTWNGSNYGDCLLDTCNTNYHEVSGACIADSQICPIDNGQGIQSWDGASWSECLVDSCLTNFHQEENSCIADLQPCDIDHGTGTKLWSGTEYGTCLVNTCDTNFHTEDNLTCISNTKVCNIENGTGQQTWNGTDWNSCQLTACNTNFVNSGNNSCNATLVTVGSYKAWADGTFAKSCNEYRNPGTGYSYIGSTGTGTYRIKPDANPAFDVLCDQTTDNGGWTNISTSFGTYTNALEQINGGMGISTGVPSSQKITGGLADLAANGSCSGNIKLVTLNKNIKELIGATQIKIEAAAWVPSGDVRCGGILYNTPLGVLTKLNTFHDKEIAACDNDLVNSGYGSGYGFGTIRVENLAHFISNLPAAVSGSYGSPSVNTTNQIPVIGQTARCGSGGTARLRITSIMIR